jgi:hypothetical protein
MTYWLREIAGWLLLVLGVWIFITVYDYCEKRWIFEAGIMLVLGIFVFRGGIHLLKVAVAARIAQKTQDRLYPAPAKPAAPPLAGRAEAKPPAPPRARVVRGGWPRS